MASSQKPTEHRLDRIESKIDKLAETVVQMARAEEKLVSLENDKKFILEKMVNLEERTLKNEQKIAETASSLQVVNRVFWIAMTTIITSLVGAMLLKK